MGRRGPGGPAARFEGPTPDLTSQKTGDFSDIAAFASKETGREIVRTVIEDEAFVQQMTSFGAPEAVARQLLGIFVAARAGEFDRTGAALSEIIGRPAQSYEDAVREALAAGRQEK